MPDRTGLLSSAASPVRELEELLRLLNALDFAAGGPSHPHGSSQASSILPGDYPRPPPTLGRLSPRSVRNRDISPPAHQVTVYDLSVIPPQAPGLEVTFLIATHLPGSSTPTLARSNALRSEERTRLRRTAGRRDLRRETWTLEGLGMGCMGFRSRAGLGPKSQARLHDRIADILDAGRADVKDGRGAEPIVRMRHWDSGRG